MRRIKKVVSTALVAAMAATMLVGCGDSSTSSSSGKKGDDGQVTIKLFSNLTDRKNGQGLVEQTIIDEYMKANPKVKIEVEALDEEAYKTKFKAYSMSGMPDVVSIWGQPAFLDEVVEAGVLAELNPSDYSDYKFVEGSLNGYTYDGKLYGLPRNTDISVFYYNQKMFEDNGWEVPQTYDELLALADKINEKGIVPVAMDGGDGWPLCVYLADVLFKITGKDYSDAVSNAIKTGDFSAPELKQAAQLLKDASDAKLFQNGYDTQDYGAAMNLFTNGQAAMFYMGSWETSMATNQDIAEDIRTNIRVFTMPTVEGGKAAATDISAWNGGGYAVNANSEVKEEAIKFLNYMYQPDKLSKYGWENGVGLSAQDQSSYMTGNETELQKQIVDILSKSTNLSGTPINDQGTSAFKTCIESEIQSVCNGSKSVDDFLSAIGNACK
ncbi:MAG: extracellular solute-binding protein [Lachnospiraceae bacterium]|nr:extracellular solute-binding protein [Lachnospiraceae bacterium]